MKTIKNKKIDINILANQLEEAKKIRENGELTFDFSVFDDLSTVLLCVIVFNAEIPKTERKTLINKAIFSCAKNGKITKESLLHEIKNLEGEFFKKTIKKFILQTQISIKNPSKIKKIIFKGIELELINGQYKEFDIKSVENLVKHNNHVLRVFSYDYVYIKVSGRTPIAAAEKGLEIINYLRGIWNFYYNYNTSTIVNFGRFKPFNKIRLGPIQTIHDLKGKLSFDGYWSQKSFIKESSPFNIEKDWGDVDAFSQRILCLIKRIKYSEIMEKVFIRYAKALDEIDCDLSFLQLWNLMEYLTNTVGNYDKTITRVLFLFQERDKHKLILEHLREYRNQYVHFSKSNDQREVSLYQLKRYVEKLMHFHIYFEGNFKSIAELGEFLNLPYDKNILKKSIVTLNNAISFIDGSSSNANKTVSPKVAKNGSVIYG